MTRARGLERSQGVQRPLCAPFLDDGDAHDHEDEAQEQERVRELAHEQVQAATGHKQQEHGLLDHLPGDDEGVARLGVGQFVVAVAE